MNLQLQLTLIIGSVLYLGITIYYIRCKGLDLYNSIRWFAGAVILLLLAIFPGVMQHISSFAGIVVPSNLVFLIMIAYLLVTSLSMSASISRQHERIKTLVQNNALLEERIEKLEKQLEQAQTTQEQDGNGQ